MKLKDLNLITRVQLYLSFLIRISLIIAAVGEIFYQRWFLLFLTAATLFLTFLPSILSKNYSIFLPVEFEFIITAFIYASIYLGDIHGFYDKFPWWDMLLHGISGLILGFIGFLIIYTLQAYNRIKLKPVFIAVFSFSFAMAVGGLWEIFEFAADSIFDLNMQKSGLVDTMWDLIIDAAGGLIIAVVGYFYTNGGDSLLFNKLICSFVKKNPKLLNNEK